MNPSEITLLLTRPEPAARRFAAEAEAAHGPFAATLLSPILEIVSLGALPAIPPKAEIAVTSENAVRIAAPVLRAHGRALWCVGTRTAAAARAEGLTPHVAGGTAEHLAQTLIAAAPEGPILHLSGVHQAGNLVERLTCAGLTAQRIAIYDQVARPLSDTAVTALRAPQPILLPLFSPRSAALLSQAVMEAGGAAPLHVVALSAAVAEAWSAPTASTTTAAAPETPAMIDAMGYLISAISGA